MIKLEVTKFLLVRILPLFVVSPLTVILSIALTSPMLFKVLLIFILLFVTTFPAFSSLDTVISLFTLNSFSFLISFEVKEPLVKIVPLFNTLFVAEIFSTAWILPEFAKFPLIFKFLAVETFPEFSNLPIFISLLTLITLSFLTSFDVKLPLVKISPVFTTFPFILILSNVCISPLLSTLFFTSILLAAWIFPLLFKSPLTFKFLAVATIPLFSSLLVVIPFFAINFLVEITSFAEKELFVNTSPLLFTFSNTAILSIACTSPLLIKLPFISNFLSVATIPEFSNLSAETPSLAINFFVEVVSLAVRFPFVRISPLFVKFPSTSILFIVCTVPVFVKPFVFNPSFVYIVALFSTAPFRLICLFACVPVPDNLILSAFIDIPSSEYAKSFCSYSFPLISIPFPWTLFTFIFPSAVISNLLFLDTIKASEFTPAPLSVLIIFITPAYIPPSSLPSIAILLLALFFPVIFPFLSILLEPATTFKSLVTTFPLNSKVFAINST